MSRSFVLSAVLGLAALGLVAAAPSTVSAHEPIYAGYVRAPVFAGRYAPPPAYRPFVPFTPARSFGIGRYEYRPSYPRFGPVVTQRTTDTRISFSFSISRSTSATTIAW
jgi:hypothetical protein